MTYTRRYTFDVIVTLSTSVHVICASSVSYTRRCWRSNGPKNAVKLVPRRRLWEGKWGKKAHLYYVILSSDWACIHKTVTEDTWLNVSIDKTKSGKGTIRRAWVHKMTKTSPWKGETIASNNSSGNVQSNILSSSFTEAAVQQSRPSIHRYLTIAYICLHLYKGDRWLDCRLSRWRQQWQSFAFQTNRAIVIASACTHICAMCA